MSLLEHLPSIRRGPLLMAGAALVFTFMVGLVKVARVELSAMEIVLWRSIVGLPLAALALRGERPRMRAPRTLLLRVLLGFAAMICFFTSAKGLPLAEHSLLTKVQPLLVALLAPVALGASEKPGRSTWLALGVGLLGCLVLFAPDLQGALAGTTGPQVAGRSHLVWGLWAVAAATFSAGAHTALRALGSTDRPAHVVFWFQLVIIPLSLGLHGLLEGSLPALPSPHLWPVVAGIGACAVLGQTLMTRAYQADRAATVAAASYTAPLWAVAGDLLFFATPPGWTTIAGGMLIVVAGLAVSLRRAPPAPQPAAADRPGPPDHAGETRPS